MIDSLIIIIVVVVVVISVHTVLSSVILIP